MTNSNGLSASEPQKPSNRTLILFGAIAFIGFLDSAYLTATHYAGSALSCGFFTGCEQVTSSAYSEVFGIPIALFGSLYYLFWICAAIFYYDTRSHLFFRALPFAILGFIASLGLMGIQIFILDAICLYCVISATSSTLIFIIAYAMRGARRSLTQPRPAL